MSPTENSFEFFKLKFPDLFVGKGFENRVPVFLFRDHDAPLSRKKAEFITGKRRGLLLLKAQKGFPQQSFSYIKALRMTTGNQPSRSIVKGDKKTKERGGHQEKEGIRKPEGKSSKGALWNFAISTVGMPDGRKTRRWTAQEAVAPFRPFSVKRRTALSTRTPPVPKKRINREEL
jgi:hypothetical protein